MNITFTPEPIPELTLTGRQLAALGFTSGTPLQVILRNRTLWVTTVTDEATWDKSAGSRFERCLQRPRRGEAHGWAE
ncbi:hypothetical protein SRDD_40000 [Serratia sp. DD3]|nr:hypothetical protein SRDD_40000 [Serratia sp. DD3]